MATKLTINNNGSVKIEGDFEIVDRNENKYVSQIWPINTKSYS